MLNGTTRVIEICPKCNSEIIGEIIWDAGAAADQFYKCTNCDYTCHISYGVEQVETNTNTK